MSRIIHILGVPMDLGQNRRGVDMGPSAIRYAGLHERLHRLGYTTFDAGNIAVPQAEETPDTAEDALPDGARAHHLKLVAATLQQVYERAAALWKPDEKMIFLGGDHSISIGTIPAVQPADIGVIWLDAHADINTPRTSPSGNIHGMPVATLLGNGAPELVNIGGIGAKLQPQQLVYLGLRDLDSAERTRLAQGDIRAYTMREIDEKGMAQIGYEILDYFKDRQHLHLSLDLDGLDPQVAPGVGTPVPGGLSYREAHLFMEILSDSGKVRSVDVVEVNPILDRQNATGSLAVELIAGLFGQKIL